MEEPVPFITCEDASNADGEKAFKFNINDKAAKLLENLEGPIGVI
jgi:hypothetical protein